MAQTENIRIGDLVAGLRSPRPLPPPDLSGAPVLDEWRWHEPPAEPAGRLVLSGVIAAGHPRIPPGRMIVTSTVREIDASDAPRWARTTNSLFRLGVRKGAMPLVLRAALASDWRDAFSQVVDATGAHTLCRDALERCRTMQLAGGDDGPAWRSRRTVARSVTMILRTCGRHCAADAWELLSSDPRDSAHAETIVGILEHDLPRPCPSQIAEIIRGWRLSAARSVPIHEDERDPIVTPRAIAAREPCAPFHARALPDVRPPAYIEALRQGGWRDAAHSLLRQAPENVRSNLERSGFLDAVPSERRRLARRTAEDLERIGRDDLAVGFKIIVVDPFNRDETKWVHDVLDKAAPFDGSDLLLQGWLLLSQGVFPHTEDDTDPVAMARAAAAARLAVAATDPESQVFNHVPSQRPQTRSLSRVVISRLGGLANTVAGREAAQEFKAIVGQALPLAKAPALAPLRSKLADEFPHLEEEIDVLLAAMLDGEPIGIAPTLLVGEPGAGKSRLARRLAHGLGVALHRFDASGSADNAFAGTPRRWSTGEPCFPLEAVRVSGSANPWILIEEIDKCGVGRQNGSLDRALLGFLEPENARAYFDPYLESAVDLGCVGYVLTANDAKAVAKPLRDRLRLIVLPEPSIEHLPQLARAIVDEIAAEAGGDPRWSPHLDDGELAIAETLWPGGSVRQLRTIVTRILSGRQSRARQ